MAYENKLSLEPLTWNRTHKEWSLAYTDGAMIHNSLPSELWLLKWAVVQPQKMSGSGRSDCRSVLPRGCDGTHYTLPGTGATKAIDFTLVLSLEAQIAATEISVRQKKKISTIRAVHSCRVNTLVTTALKLAQS